MDHVDCRGSEKKLVDCHHPWPLGVHICEHNQDVGVSCAPISNNLAMINNLLFCHQPQLILLLQSAEALDWWEALVVTEDVLKYLQMTRGEQSVATPSVTWLPEWSAGN